MIKDLQKELEKLTNKEKAAGWMLREVGLQFVLTQTPGKSFGSTR